MKFLARALALLGSAFFSSVIAGCILSAVIYAVLEPELPNISDADDFHLDVPLRIYTADNQLMAEFGVQRRDPVRFDEIPPSLAHAFLSAEDDRFFQHPGIDWQGIVRAVLELVKTGRATQGGSTITMQLARNFFLSPEKSYKRKLLEVFLSLRVEAELSKEDILQLYLNKIYLGNRAYGISAAAQVYYGLSLDELSIAQIAMIAGLPKAPSAYNPIINPKRALIRRNYVLRRMLQLSYIDQATYDTALGESISANLQPAAKEIDAGYVAEMVRQQLLLMYGEQAYTLGLIVHTTIDSKLQNQANFAVRQGLLEYDRRHGWRGPVAHVDLANYNTVDLQNELLDSYPSVGNLAAALVTDIRGDSASVYVNNGENTTISFDTLAWAKPYIDVDKMGDKPKKITDVLLAGDIVWLQKVIADDQTDTWVLSQIPEVQSAFTAIDPKTGAIQALVGGFDFETAKFNRVTQARRQPGSSFKPFLYSAALEKGYSVATLINDAPVVYDADEQARAWRPENSSKKFYGPTRLRVALANSRNLVSIRILRDIGVDYVRDYAEQFGLSPAWMPRDLSLSLGSLLVQPIDVIAAYSTFANGGYKVDPWFIASIETSLGQPLYEATPAVVCSYCNKPKLANPQVGAFSMPQPVVTESTLTEAEQTAEDIANEASTAAVEPETEEIPSATASADSDTMDQEPDAITLAELPALRPAERIISAENAYLMTSVLRDVIQVGTARKAKKLGRGDLSGKTGTTNDQKDAWFVGFNPDLVAGVWVGFDELKTLGRREYGGSAALPIWMYFMEGALADKPEKAFIPPQGLVSVRISPETGERARPGDPEAIFETFRVPNLPPAFDEDDQLIDPFNEGQNTAAPSPYVDELF